VKTTSKKPQSKPAAKKAVRTPQPLNPWASDSHLIDGIAARVEELAAELKAANRKLDYVVARLRSGHDREAEEFEN
jgi:hypothetical protein